MTVRPVVASSLAVALLAGAVTALPAGAAPPPATGAARADLVVAELALATQQLAVGSIGLRSDTRGSRPEATLTVTPVELDGTAYGEQRWSSASADPGGTAFDSRSLAPVPADRLLRWQGRVAAGPHSSGDGASASAGTTTLGSVELLGLPVVIDGSLESATGVDPAAALGEHRLVVERLELPSLVDLLAARGLDLTALPPQLLADLVEALGLVDDAVRDAKVAVDAALAPVSGALADAQADLVDAGTAVDAADAALAASSDAVAVAGELLDAAARALHAAGAEPTVQAASLLDPVLDPALDPALEPLPVPSLPGAPALPGPLPPTGPVPSLPLPDLPAAPADPVALLEDYTDALQTYDGATAVLDAAGTTVALAERELQAVLDRIAALVAPARAELDALTAAAVGALDRQPLLAVDRLEVRGRSAVAAHAGTPEVAEVVTSVGAVRVLGADVLAAGALDALDAAVADRLALAAAVLAEVPGLPRLDVPLPEVRLLESSTSTSDGDAGVGGAASSALRVVTVSLPPVSVPAELAVPRAAALPAHGQAVTATFLRLGEEAQVAGRAAAAPPPATPAEPVGPTDGSTTGSVPVPTAGARPGDRAPSTGSSRVLEPVASGRTLPRTGPADVAALLGVLLVGAALGLRRRSAAADRASTGPA